MTPIAIATEDELSEAIVLRMLKDTQESYYITHKLRKGGFGYLHSRMRSWYQMAEHQVMLVLTDLDRVNCLLEFRAHWLHAEPPDNLVFRVAVKEVESWILADHYAVRHLIGPRGALPPSPDSLVDPKQTLLQLSKGAPRHIKSDLLRITGGNLTQGLGYNTLLSAWVQTEWCPNRAAERSPSLARARLRLKKVISSFQPPV